MKLAFFDDFKLGVVKGDAIHDVSAVVKDIPHVGPGDLISGLIAKFEDYRGKLEAAATGAGTPVANVRIRPPLPKPGNIVCMAVNYMEDGTLAEARADQCLPQSADRHHRTGRHDGAARRPGNDL